LAADNNPWVFLLLLFSGLHLILIWTPWQLCLTFLFFFKPFGEKRARKTALALSIILKILPEIMEDGLNLKKTMVARKIKGSFARKFILWAEALITLTFSKTDSLTRALLKR
jgi:hypothetical protein